MPKSAAPATTLESTSHALAKHGFRKPALHRYLYASANGTPKGVQNRRDLRQMTKTVAG
jgi:hypothetical protein